MLSASPLMIARQKLQATDVPIVLRVSYYLRLSCSVLDANSSCYSQLMKALYIQDPAWLETCMITPLGTLRSSHCRIDELLQPITTLHQTHQLTELDLPIAA